MSMAHFKRTPMSASLLAAFVLSSAAIADEWDDADRKVVRVSPSQFQELPSSIKQELENRGCRVPQPWGLGGLQNVISGEFAKRGQKDWAILCSRDRSSKLLIFWGGEQRCPSEISESEDRGWLQGTGYGIGYSRVISTVGKSFIDGAFEAYGGPTPPNIDHEGIDEAFMEKASLVYYCHDGKWLELSGAD